MRMQINPKWAERMRQNVEAYVDPLKRGVGFYPEKIDETISYNPAVQWLICLLAQKNIPFKVVQLGAGVKRVTTDVHTCPKCNGTGRC
jgi:hypothetical protein